jgi:hypothetical protein
MAEFVQQLRLSLFDFYWQMAVFAQRRDDFTGYRYWVQKLRQLQTGPATHDEVPSPN